MLFSKMKMYLLSRFLLLVYILNVEARIWETIYLQQTEHCERRIRNDYMAHGDGYLVLSDSSDGMEVRLQRPAECAIGFNFGDRHISVQVPTWRCEPDSKEPFITIYENCLGLMVNPLETINCSSANVMLDVRSSGSCVSIYHYRGQANGGYYFEVLVKAEEEIIAFPAGGVAAVLVFTIVAIMVLVKFICVVTGYENRLPMLNLDPVEERQIIANARQAIQAARQRYHMEEPPPPATGSAENLLEEEPRYSAQVVATETGHRVLRVTHSNSSNGRPITPGTGTTAEFDYDFVNAQVVDRPTPAPSLNRFPSFKGASIWRSK